MYDNFSFNQILNLKTETQFNTIAMQVFKYQAINNPVYAQFLKHLKINIAQINQIKQIPFLPIDFFKYHKIVSQNQLPQIVFKSSGTTASAQSQHFVNNVEIYQQSYTQTFETFYGDIQNSCILALLPNYLERDGSSLIYMVNDFINKSSHQFSGFFLYDTDDLLAKLLYLKQQNQKTILFGVTYALLDFVEKHQISFPNLMVIETGGMKGKRKEIIRETLHQQLQKGFGVSHIHSEYGMTEMLSQAYALSDGIFKAPNWLKILIRETNDPFNFVGHDKTGGINVIDLANINSCSFLATQDLGKTHANNTFEVLGRFDNSDLRGCNLLVE